MKKVIARHFAISFANMTLLNTLSFEIGVLNIRCMFFSLRINKMEHKKSASEKLVWARMKFCPYWPARIVEPPPIIGKIPNGKQCVLFFGTKE